MNGLRARSFMHTEANGFSFASREVLSDDVVSTLVALLSEKQMPSPQGVLSGRRGIVTRDMPGLGPIFVKRYAHGGILRGITSERFIATGEPRSFSEFLTLERVRELGVAAPRPIVCVTQGKRIYKTWLIMEEILQVSSFVELCETDTDSLAEYMKSVGKQVSVLIREKILHVDLHPGNVLVDSNRTVYLIDFDKAKQYNGSVWQLRDFYIRRWRRAVIKHRLPSILTELLSLELRSYSE